MTWPYNFVRIENLRTGDAHALHNALRAWEYRLRKRASRTYRTQFYYMRERDMYREHARIVHDTDNALLGRKVHV